ncbi:MAG: hypothetical protein NZL99_04785, partial [Burkholderiaceae bacterium]|nr:hypothetical protein [Burkholderiaceae bacterium]
RALLILLVLVLPFKAVAAAVVPIVGSPSALLAEMADAGAHGHCDSHGDQAVDPLHQQGCPHVAMLMLPAASPVIESGRRAPGVAPEAERAPPSVILDVLLPPPTA